MLNGQMTVLFTLPCSDLLFRFSPLQWRLIHMCDGRSSWAEISARFEQETGTSVLEQDVSELASFLQSNSPLIWKSPLERNITLQEELRSSRKKRRSRQLDFDEITIKNWYDADG